MKRWKVSSKKKDYNEKRKRKPAAKYYNSCRAANFQARITKFQMELLFYFSLHPSFLDVFLWRQTWYFPALNYRPNYEKTEKIKHQYIETPGLFFNTFKFGY